MAFDDTQFGSGASDPDVVQGFCYGCRARIFVPRKAASLSPQSEGGSRTVLGEYCDDCMTPFEVLLDD